MNIEILISTEGEVTREMIRLDATKIFTTPKGETVIDFGQNITGYVEWDVPQKKGAEFIIHHAEILDKDGKPVDSLSVGLFACLPWRKINPWFYQGWIKKPWQNKTSMI